MHNEGVPRNQKGFGVLEILLFIVLVGILAGLGWRVWSQDRATLSKTGAPAYKGKLGAAITASTDDSFVNRFELDLKMDDILVGCASTTTASASANASYGADSLSIDLRVYVRHRDIPTGAIVCAAVPQPYSYAVDLDKDWLAKPGTKAITVNGHKYALSIDPSTRAIRLTGSGVEGAVGGITANFLYPDRVAILSDSCDNSMSALDAFVSANGLTRASKQYPKLGDEFQHPGRELNIIYDSKARTAYGKQTAADKRQVGTKYDPNACRITINKPYADTVSTLNPY